MGTCKLSVFALTLAWIAKLFSWKSLARSNVYELDCVRCIICSGTDIRWSPDSDSRRGLSSLQRRKPLVSTKYCESLPANLKPRRV